MFTRQQRYSNEYARTLIFFDKDIWEMKAVLERNGFYPPASELPLSPIGVRYVSSVVSRTCDLRKKKKKVLRHLQTRRLLQDVCSEVPFVT